MAGGHHRSGSGVTTPSIDVRIDRSALRRAIADIGERQIPFAIALTVNSLAKGVVVAERDEVARTFSTPTPFTENAFRIETATKARPVARVAIKDIQAGYLEPYVKGGVRSLGTKRGMLAPITGNIALNKYGNLTRNKLKTLAARPGVYIGPITTRGGKRISGVWQRSRGRGGASLKLLIKFADTTPVKKRLDFYGRATRHVRDNLNREFAAAVRQAAATARP